MKVIYWDDFILNGIPERKEGAITIGVFDGLHLGHQRLVQSVLSYAEKRGNTETLVFTFCNNPSSFFHPRQYLGNISTLRQKLELFSEFGVQHIVLIDFSADFSKLTGNGFFSIIGEHIEIEYVCLGKNFHCGRNNDTHSEQVKQMLGAEGKTVEIIDQILFKNEPVSSTRIRREIINGNITDVNSMLGKQYELDCIDGVSEINQIIPGDGNYTVKLKSVSEEEKTTNITISGKKLIFPEQAGKIEEIKTIQFIDRVIEERSKKNGYYERG